MQRLIPSCNVRIPPELQIPMSDMDIDNEVNVQASTSLWNLDKKQDFVWKGVDTYGNSCNVVADGHGSDIVINILRAINDKLWEECFNDIDVCLLLNLTLKLACAEPGITLSALL